MLCDTHCHIDGAKYQDKAELIDRANRYNVGIIINSGSDVFSSEQSLKLSQKFPSVYFSAGVHPDSADTFGDEQLSRIKELAENEKCVAIGEIGLDYHYKPFDEAKQKSAFIKQLELAKSLKLPAVIHSRDAHSDTLSVVREVKPELLTMHCFSGSKEIAKEYLDMGYYLSFGGTLTFKNNVKTVEVLKYAPLDRVITETDSPYLSPEPERGTLNEPSKVRFVLEKISQLKNISYEKAESVIEQNVRTLFYKIKK